MSNKAPKYANTLQLKDTPDEARLRANIIPGMAYFAATGPSTEYCRRCRHFAAETRTVPRTIIDGCVPQGRTALVEEATGRGTCLLVKGRGKPRKISDVLPACKYFDRES